MFYINPVKKAWTYCTNEKRKITVKRASYQTIKKTELKIYARNNVWINVQVKTA